MMWRLRRVSGNWPRAKSARRSSDLHRLPLNGPTRTRTPDLLCEASALTRMAMREWYGRLFYLVVR